MENRERQRKNDLQQTIYTRHLPEVRNEFEELQ